MTTPRSAEGPQPRQEARLVGDRPPELGQALARYQAGDVAASAEVILCAVEGRMGRALRQLPTVPGTIEREDLRQQLAMEVLNAAHHIRLDAEIWIPRMLVERATRAVRRWSARQTRLSCLSIGDELISVPDVLVDEHVPGLPRLKAAGVSRQDAELLFRQHVLGQPLSMIAAASGITASAAKSRSARAARRLRHGSCGGLSPTERPTMPGVGKE